MIGRPVVIAIALARPVVEPPPTLTRTSTSLTAAASRARWATSTGTCITTSSCRTATGMSPAIVSARCASALAAISMTLVAPRWPISPRRLAAAAPEPKATRCGRVSWTKRMVLIVLSPAEQGGEGVPERLLGVGGQGHRAPADELVRADEQHAVLVDLAQPRPVVVDVGDLAPWTDDHRLERNAKVVAYLRGGRRPRLAGDAGDQRERVVLREVERGGLVGAPLVWRGADPGVRQVRAGDGGGLVVQLGVALGRRPGTAVALDGRRLVELAEVDSVRVELVVLQLHRLDERRPLGRAARRVGLALLDLRPHLLLGLGVGEAENLEELDELAARLVGARDDLPGYRGALRRGGIKEFVARLVPQHRRELPRQVVGVLDARVGAEAVRRRVPVDRVARAEAPPLLQVGGEVLVVAPEGRAGDLNVEVRDADQVPDDLGGLFRVDLRRRLSDVVAPDDQPLVPRADHADQAGADAADVGPGLDDPVEDGRARGDVLRYIGFKGDIHRAGDVHLALEWQPGVLGDQGPGAVRADQVLRPDVVDVAGEAISHGGRDPGLVLGVAQVLGGEPGLGTARRGVLHQDRLKVGLRDVADQARRCLLVVGLAGRVGAPGEDAADLLAGDARAEDGVADQCVRRGVREHLVLDAEVAEDLHRPLVGDVRARRVGRPPVLRDHDVRYA